MFENSHSKDPLKSGTGELPDSRRSNQDPVSNKDNKKDGNLKEKNLSCWTGTDKDKNNISIDV